MVINLCGGRRNIDSVRQKLNNISSFDLRGRSEKPEPVREHSQKLLGDLYSRYGREYNLLDKLIDQIQIASSLGEPADIDSVEKNVQSGNTWINEGERVTTTGRTRSDRLRGEARKYHKQLDPEGFLRCAACGFTASPELADKVIEIHHLRKISEDECSRRVLLKDAVKDTAPLCPTCHRICHTKNIPYTVEEISSIVAR
jgi:predicted HNH restriction endonuclease